MKSFEFKRTQHKYKTAYRISNWPTYEAGLRQRGSVTVWLSEDARKTWCHTGRRKPGGKRLYSTAAIETFFTIRLIYGLALRQTEGFIRSLFDLAGIGLPVPDHSTVSRRVRKLGTIPLLPRIGSGPIPAANMDIREPRRRKCDVTGIVGFLRQPLKAAATRPPARSGDSERRDSR